MQEKITITNFYTNIDNMLEIEFNKNHVEHKAMWLDEEWIASDNLNNNLNKDKIIYDNIHYSVVVKNNNKVIFEDKTLPTLAEIEEATGVSLSQGTIQYGAFRVEKNFSWDKKTHIISVGLNKTTSGGLVHYSKFHHFYAIKVDEKYLIGSIEWDYNGFLMLNDPIINYQQDIKSTIVRTSLSEKASFCHKKIVYIIDAVDYSKCLIREEDKIIPKKLFGELYPADYYKSIASRYEEIQNATAEQYFFDEEDNMHLFYTKEAHIGEYYNYEMYTPDEPLVPKYEQKIYWR